MTIASAPASAANLGPGFDVLALALDLRVTVTVEPSDKWVVTSAGKPAIERTVQMVTGVAADMGPHVVGIESQIPIGRGLGSSAALLVAAGAALRGAIDRDRLLWAAAAVEGHPDNVAASLYGGLVAVGADGGVARLGLYPSLRVLVAVPDEELSTYEARRVLTPDVSRGVAVRTSARLALLVEALRSGEEHLFEAALGDEMHEGPRGVMTETPARLIRAALQSGARYAAWSGAGPSVVAFTDDESMASVATALDTSLEAGGRVFELAVDREGVRIE